MNYSPLKIDFHVHTRYSHDSNTSLREVLVYAKRRGLDGVAITDHDTVEGGLKLSKLCRKKGFSFIVIQGLEVSSKHGHILALNVSEPVRPGRDIVETIEEIHDKGGLAVLSHPFSFFKGIPLRELMRAKEADAIEVINSCAIPFSISTRLGMKYARALKLPELAGSDAHIPEVIGLSYCEVYSDPEVEEVLKAVKKGYTRPYGSGISIYERIKAFLRNRKS
ncbi:PHP domain-containing protein [Candidatus Bathyarchaeota archaeon]|nr:PHP domain-containing protein [Candidatus Bathyarchaeota archaeon]